MSYLKIVLLLIYSIAVVKFCYSSLRDIKSAHRPKSILDWYCALILPIVAALGGFAHYFNPTLPDWAWYAAVTIWVSACIAFFYELRDLRQNDEKVTIFTVLFGLLLIGLLFGPGIYLMAAWLFH
jgi:ABC-type uncharacterized transport system permease subunit